jgi:hypothetical protein
MRRFTSLAAPLLAAALLVVTTTPAQAIASDPDPAAWMANGFVKASVQYGNVMFIGGNFTTVAESVKPGSVSANGVTGLTGLAAINMTTGQAIPAFRPQLAAGAKQTRVVYALAIVGNRLYVGGQFSTVGGKAHLNLAAIDIDPSTFAGTIANNFNPVVGVPKSAGEVRTILAGSDGLYVGGTFTKVNGVGRQNTAKLNWNGTLVNTYNTPGNGNVQDMVWATDNASIFLAGAFTQLGGNKRYAIGRVNPATGATLPWAVPSSDIPGATTTGQTCYELAVTLTRLFAGCGRKPNFVGAFHLDNGNTGNRTWQYSTGGNVQSIALLSNGNDLAFGGHFGINSHSGYDGSMPVCAGQYLRALGILRNVTTPTAATSPNTNGLPLPTQPYLDCGFLPNVDGQTAAGPNFNGTNPFGGVWEIQITGNYLWALGEFQHINTQVRRSIARFSGPN